MECLYNPINNVLTPVDKNELAKQLGISICSLNSYKRNRSKIRKLDRYLVDSTITLAEKKELMKKVQIDDEEWKSLYKVKGFENFTKYKVSNYGRVIDKYEKIVMPNVKAKGKGTLLIGLTTDEGKRVYMSIIKLVANAFVDNPNKYKCYRHIGDKLDNHYKNIVWCTKEELEKEILVKNLEKINDKPILKLDKDTFKILEEYKNSCDAERKEVGMTSGTIRYAVSNNSITYGYRWCRKKDYVKLIEAEYKKVSSRLKEIKISLKESKKIFL